MVRKFYEEGRLTGCDDTATPTGTLSDVLNMYAGVSCEEWNLLGKELRETMAAKIASESKAKGKKLEEERTEDKFRELVKKLSSTNPPDVVEELKKGFSRRFSKNEWEKMGDSLYEELQSSHGQIPVEDRVKRMFNSRLWLEKWDQLPSSARQRVSTHLMERVEARREFDAFLRVNLEAVAPYVGYSADLPRACSNQGFPLEKWDLLSKKIKEGMWARVLQARKKQNEPEMG